MTEKTPANVAYLRGTNRPDRLSADTAPVVNAPLIESVPPPPLWLPNHHAVTEWVRLAPILIELKLLTEGSLSALAQLCALHGVVVQSYAAGIPPGASTLGTLRNLHNDFGLSPASQGKVRGEHAKEEPKANSFGRTGRKPKNA